MFVMVTPKDIFAQTILCEDSKLNLVSKLWHKVFVVPPSTTFFLNLLNWLKLLLSKCLVLLKMSKILTLLIS
jgi:hypothetical protein